MSSNEQKKSRGSGKGRGRGIILSQSSGSNQNPEETSHQGATSSQKHDCKRKVHAILPEEIGLQLKRKMTLNSLPSNPGEGTLGKRIKLTSNCFPLRVPSGNVYHYDVTITKKHKESGEGNGTLLPSGTDAQDKKYRCLSTKRNREVIALMMRTNDLFDNSLYSAYDGKNNLFTRNPLRAYFPVKCEVHLPDENSDPDNPRQDVFRVQIKPTIKSDGSCIINLDSLHFFYDGQTSSVPQETIMALETILRHGPCLRFTPVGRSFFYPPNVDSMHPLGGGLEIWFGYHQSIRIGQWGPMVNINRTATTFHEPGPVLKYIADCMGVSIGDLRRRPYLSSIDIKRLSNKLKNIKIEVTHLRNYRRKYRIFRLVKETPKQIEFEMTQNGRNVIKTVAAYFRERYGKILEFPNLPCIQVYPESKKSYLPIEVCEIVAGQHSKRKLEPRQVANVNQITAVSPIDRFKQIKEIVDNPEFNDRHIREFDLRVSSVPIDVEGRVLDSPNLQYNNAEIIKPIDGSWTMRNNKFLHGATIESWVLLNFSDVEFKILEEFSKSLVDMGRKTGMRIGPPEFIETFNLSRCDLKNLFLKIKMKYKADLVVIVISPKDKFIYGKIKLIAEIDIGLITQCIKDVNIKNPKKCNMQFFNNVCQKINVKTGGENNSLVICEVPEVLRKPVIIIGADVNHPGALGSVKPSLAACVGSLNSKLSRYAVSIRAQVNIDEKKKAVEIILDLKKMIVELLTAFYKHTNRQKPSKIIFYRDGVSEGQFEMVRDNEVRSIREACRALEADYEPGITFIVVQKRHHVRFKPKDSRDGVGNMKNIPPGTTIDTGVTDPVKFDFFLCSHHGLKGTSRPSYYTVMEDDNNFNANDLQKLTYQLCHIYARCTRSISIPVPVAYADLAAYRAHLHLEAKLEETSGSSDSSSGSDFQPLSDTVIDSVKIMRELKSAMYFV